MYNSTCLINLNMRSNFYRVIYQFFNRVVQSPHSSAPSDIGIFLFGKFQEFVGRSFKIQPDKAQIIFIKKSKKQHFLRFFVVFAVKRRSKHFNIITIRCAVVNYPINVYFYLNIFTFIFDQNSLCE